FLTLYPDVRVLATVNAVATFLPLLAIVIHAQLTLDDVSLHPRHFARTEFRRMWSFSIWFMMIHVSSLIAARVDTLVIKWALDLDAIAVYAL
ncbi:MAG: oligosaccharide flippase family protein, partial [Gammaproteobacteria bacterium]|nr:oligosaccharide flippase family protein [Gammaproteobacteria bacterium]NIR83649.1 oligosaccharide flippase family protein [Gammaproteobacteria bacterium]NIU04811.1 oligosaccharide flippase family protein [Gammaproteobacteria bacterium]NIV51797.1 oligosaccharide flippase family protein [Gammaproteobacteria bacterium]NIX86085.1 oligosaccharide flippase family protein [Gammaproteobacteria bacterium]